MRRSFLPVAVLVVLATLATSTQAGWWGEFWSSVGRDFHRNNCWPEPLRSTTLSVVEILVALFPLRRGEAWAFWAALLPLISLVLPMLLVDAGHVAPQHRFNTLTPIIVGLVLAICGLILVRSAGT